MQIFEIKHANLQQTSLPQFNPQDNTALILEDQYNTYSGLFAKKTLTGQVISINNLAKIQSSIIENLFKSALMNEIIAARNSEEVPLLRMQLKKLIYEAVTTEIFDPLSFTEMQASIEALVTKYEKRAKQLENNKLETHWKLIKQYFPNQDCMSQEEWANAWASNEEARDLIYEGTQKEEDKIRKYQRKFASHVYSKLSNKTKATKSIEDFPAATAAPKKRGTAPSPAEASSSSHTPSTVVESVKNEGDLSTDTEIPRKFDPATTAWLKQLAFPAPFEDLRSKIIETYTRAEASQSTFIENWLSNIRQTTKVTDDIWVTQEGQQIFVQSYKIASDIKDPVIQDLRERISVEDIKRAIGPELPSLLAAFRAKSCSFNQSLESVEEWKAKNELYTKIFELINADKRKENLLTLKYKGQHNLDSDIQAAVQAFTGDLVQECLPTPPPRAPYTPQSFKDLQPNINAIFANRDAKRRVARKNGDMEQIDKDTNAELRQLFALPKEQRAHIKLSYIDIDVAHLQPAEYGRLDGIVHTLISDFLTNLADVQPIELTAAISRLRELNQTDQTKTLSQSLQTAQEVFNLLQTLQDNTRPPAGKTDIEWILTALIDPSFGDLTNIVKWSQATDEQRAEFLSIPKTHQPAFEFVQSITLHKFQFPLQRIVLSQERGMNSKGADGHSTRINIDSRWKLQQDSLFAHELAHTIEHDPAALKQSQDYRKSRSTLRTYYNKNGDHLMEGDWEQKGGSAYSGSMNIYHGKELGTEVLSMGVQRLFQNPARFIEDDPEYAAFTINTARGIKWPPSATGPVELLPISQTQHAHQS